MPIDAQESGHAIYDPRRVVKAEPVPISTRVSDPQGLRLAVIDNNKWNG